MVLTRGRHNQLAKARARAPTSRPSLRLPHLLPFTSHRPPPAPVPLGVPPGALPVPLTGQPLAPGGDAFRKQAGPSAAPQQHCTQRFWPYKPLFCIFVLTYKGEAVRKVPEATSTLPHGPSSPHTSRYTWAALAGWDPAYPETPSPLPSPGEPRGKSPGST